MLDRERKRAILADLAVASDAIMADGKTMGLDQTRDAKIAKYTPLARALQQQGWRE